MDGNEIKSLMATTPYINARFNLQNNYDVILEKNWVHSRPPQSLAEMIYVIVNDITEFPKCRNGNERRFGMYYKDGYYKSCFDEECGCVKEDRADSIRARTPEQKKAAADTYRETMQRRYGVDNVFQLESIKNKSKETNLEKFGTEYASQSAVVKEKTEKTNMDRYGTTCSLLSEGAKIKADQTNLERYGTIYPTQNAAVIEKTKATNLDRYGVANTFEYEPFKEKAKQTMQERYGVDNISQLHLSEYTKSIIHNPEEFRKFCTGKSFERVSDLLKDVSAVHIGALARQYDCIEVFAFGKGSIYQSQVEDWLTSLGITFVRNNRSIISPKEIDIWMPQFNLGIEIDGLFYHSEIAGNKAPSYHYDKQEAAIQAGVRLVQVFTDEWMFRPDLIKSIILSKIGLLHSINVSECNVEKIEWDRAQTFLGEHHISGAGRQGDAYALVRDDEIMMVMTFGENELIRYAQSISINGGMERLVHHAMVDLGIVSLTTILDRRFYSGASLGEIGFVQTGVIDQDCRFTDYYKRYQDEELGCDLVWDAGQTVWKYSKPS